MFLGVEGDATDDLAGRLGVSADLLRQALGGPLSVWLTDPDLGEQLLVYTGLADPRTPGRPLVALRLSEETLDIGHSVGVSLPNNEMQWSLAEPRTQLDYDDESDEVILCDHIREAVAAVASAAMLRGTSWD